MRAFLTNGGLRELLRSQSLQRQQWPDVAFPHGVCYEE